ncbi:hypothetical protein HFP89_13460 [Wenzhouxiangella sp. XN79A]|uniref:hypothetical protein n=1 Tax=Wenzhouxiangella sp. XN79A TaxID=2724193 RepID=UPI00144AB20B|nr:hypothetical protein [Wenzhouxiangella sp. XN79A]NKI36173.1 hypothetical protein [Wenzhouxiangella sp. XN79A]
MLPRRTLSAASLAQLGNVWSFSACWVVAGLILYMLADLPSGPAVFPDEVCRLAWARLLSGTAPAYDMSPAAFCQPYYPMLLAPVLWFTSESEAVYRAVFVINTAAASLCLPLAVRIALRHLEMKPCVAWTAGLAVLAFPAVTLFRNHALPEALLFPAVLMVFSTWCSWVDRPSWSRFYSLLLGSVVLFALHQKMLVLPLALISGAVIGHFFDRSRAYRIRLLGAGLGLSCLFLLNALVRSAGLDAGFAGSAAGGPEVAVRLLSPQYFLDIVVRAAGVMVYSTWVTGGLVCLVGAGLLAAAARFIRASAEPIDRFWKNTAFPVGLFVLLAGLTAVYFSSGARFDTLFYGRHVNAALASLLLPAIAMVFQGRVDRAALIWLLAIPVITTIVLFAGLPDSDWFDFSRIHVHAAGPVMEWMFRLESRSALLGFCVAIMGLSLLMGLTHFRGVLRLLGLVPFLVITCFIHLTTRPFEGVTIEEAVPSSAASVLRSAEPCRIHFSALNGGRLRMHQYFRLQYYFPKCEIEMLEQTDQPPRGGLVVMRETYAECENDVVCHPLHPDLVLYRSVD